MFLDVNANYYYDSEYQSLFHVNSQHYIDLLLC